MEKLARLWRVCSGWRPVKFDCASIVFLYWSVYKEIEHRIHLYPLKSCLDQ
jgi:hypothetical protein